MKYNEQFKKLNDLGFVGRGKSKHRPRNDSSLYGGKYPFVQTGDVKRAEFYLNSFSQTYNEKGLAQSKLWNEGTLCITIAANIAETAILGIKACFPDSIIGFVPDTTKADVRYIKYCLETYKMQMQSISQGTTQDNLSLEKLLAINFKVPPLPIQIRIADILSSYDELIENNQKRIAVLENMAEQLYKEWFVSMRFPGHQNTKFTKGVPEGWEYKNLKQVVKTQYGFTASAEANSEIGPKFLRITDIAQKELKWSEVPYCTLPDKDLEKYKLNHGDVVIARTGATVGYAKLIINPPKAVFASYLVRLVPKSKLDIFLVGIAVESNDFKKFIQSVATGAAQPQANAELMSLFTILVPTDEIKVKFNSVVEPCFLETDILKKQNENLRQTRDLLLPRLISGKLSVQKAEKQMEAIA